MYEPIFLCHHRRLVYLLRTLQKKIFMKQFFKMFFASLLAMVVASVIVFGLFIAIIVGVSKTFTDKNKKEVKTSEKSILRIDLKNRYHEQGAENSLAAFSSDIDGYAAGLYDAVHAIHEAKDDDNIKGIYIAINGNRNGWATSQQVRDAIKDFKTSGKFVYAYGELIGQSDYYIASVADSVFLNPVGDFELKGFATVLAFFKGTLDKLEVEPEIFYAGKFKSATEPFRAYEMSDANRQQIQEFQSDFWGEYVKAVAEHTKADAATINEWVISGAIEFPEDALQHKLVDRLMYADEVEAKLKEESGIDEDKKIKFIGIDKYASSVKMKSGDDKIAILFAEGSIVDGDNNDAYQIASKAMREEIIKIRKDEDIKAVVLRVNSPGGSALASEVILRELQILKSEKPLIVSMGDYAASGGYYISCQADSIFVMPNTITGSIGVFTMMFNGEKLLKNKLGVTFDEVKNAPYADFPSGVRPMTADEGQRVQRSVDKVYTTFKSRVAEGRKMSMDAVDSIAQGRVWTGSDAIAIGLADAYGDLDRAVQSAAAMAKIDDYGVKTYPKPVDEFQILIKNLRGTSIAAEVVKQGLKADLGEEYQFLKQLKDLSRMNGITQMAMPFKLTVR